MKILLTFLVVLSGLLLSVGCHQEKKDDPLSQEARENSLAVAATTSLVTHVVEKVAGDTVTVTGLMALGENPHAYVPTPQDMAMVETADILFVNGFDLEENLLHDLENVAAATIVEVSAQVIPITPEEKHEEEGHAEEAHHEETHAAEAEEHAHHEDPHTWMSLLNVISWCDVIAEALGEADPSQAALYRENAESYKKELEALHQEILTTFEGIPAERRILVTDHNVFGYFARDYGFTVVKTIVPSFSTESEVSSQELAEVVETLRANQIDTLYIGETAPDSLKKLGEVIAAELNYPVKIYPVLTGSLTEAGGRGDSYVKFIRYNVSQISEGSR